MSTKIIKTKKLAWVDIENPSERTMRSLRKEYNFHPLDIKDCLGVTQRPKIDVYDKYIFLVLHFPDYNQKTRRIIINELEIFCGRNYLITVHKEKLAVVSKYFSNCKKNLKIKQEVFKNGSGYLLYKLLDVIFSTYFPAINQIGKDIAETEEEVYEGLTKVAVQNLATLRRNILNLRRLIEPQRLILNILVQLKRKFLAEELDVYFDDIRDRLEKIWAILETDRETIEGLYATNESLLSYRTNEIIKILTIISVALLPLTLFTGIYGMNISGLPFADHPFSVWVIFSIILLAIALFLGYLKKKDWI